MSVIFQGRRLVFLPPYSPDYSPIEQSFSCGMNLFVFMPQITSFLITTNLLVKAHLRRHYHCFVDSECPEQNLINACFEAVSPEKAKGWFRDCGYLPM